MSILRTVQLRTTNSPIDSLVQRVWRGDMILDAEYQRGSVWNDERRRNLIRSLMMGLPIGAIFINERPFPHPAAVIDGKQRIEAVSAFLAGGLWVPREWWPREHTDGLRANEPDVFFPELSPAGQRLFTNTADVACYWADFRGDLPSIIRQETELFNLVNFGGVPQGESDV